MDYASDAEYAIKSWEHRKYALVVSVNVDSRFQLFFEVRTRGRRSRFLHRKLTSCYRKEKIKEKNKLRIYRKSVGLKNQQADFSLWYYVLYQKTLHSAKISRSCPILLGKYQIKYANFKYAKPEKKLYRKMQKKKILVKKKIIITQQIYSVCMRKSIYNFVCTNVILYIYKQTGKLSLCTNTFNPIDLIERFCLH